MSEAQPIESEKKKAPRRIKAGKLVFGPCGSCAFFDAAGTKASHTTGHCHGRAPDLRGWAVVQASEIGCGDFVAAMSE